MNDVPDDGGTVIMICSRSYGYEDGPTGTRLAWPS